MLDIKKCFRILLILPIISSQIGCSVFRSGRQNFIVMASDPQAKIYVNNEYKGVGNVDVLVPRNKPVMVRVEKEGCQSISRIIETKLSTTGVLDTIGGWLILLPFIGLAFPGAYELEKSSLTMNIEER